MDRTAEFFAIIDQRKSQVSVVHPPRPPITRSEFTGEASEIGAAIYATAEKLGKLTQLAQSKSLFEDPTAEINAMTGLIKTEIVALNAKLSELQGRMRQNRSRTKQRESHSTSVVESLTSQLQGATRDFQDVLYTRSANIKLLQDRREQFSGHSSGGGAGGSGAAQGRSREANQAGAGGFGSSGSVPASIFECPAALAPPAGSSSSSSGGGGVGGGGGVIIDMPQMMMQQEMMMGGSDQNHAFLESRANAVDAVQGTIAELGAACIPPAALCTPLAARLHPACTPPAPRALPSPAALDRALRCLWV